MKARRTAVRVGVAVVAFFLAGGCVGGDAKGPAVVERDSAGIHIVENAPFDSTTATWWSIDPEAVVSIGNAEGDDVRTLFRVADAMRLADGRILIANSGTSEIRLFSADGEPRASWGRRGDGPGEYGGIARALPLPGDSLLVFDMSKARITILAPDGSFGRNFNLPSAPFTGFLGRYPDGTLIIESGDFSSDVPRDGRRRMPTKFVLRDASGEAIDSIGPVAGADMSMHVTEEGGRIRSIEFMRVPFGPTTVAAIPGDVLWIGTQDAPELRAWSRDGNLVRILRTGASVQPVTDELRNEVIDAAVARAAESEPPERLPDVRARWADTEMADVVPPYGTLQSDEDGNLWVSEFAVGPDLPRRWTVFGTDGIRRAAIVLPEGMRVLKIGTDYIIVVERDDLDVEYVRLYRLRRN